MNHQQQYPFETLFNQKPQYDHMRVLSCLAYIKENRAGKDILIGYPQG